MFFTLALLLVWVVTPATAQQVDNLCAGQTQNVGTVTVSNDTENVYVTFATAPGAFIIETHAHVATELAGIPQTKGKVKNPIPGSFAQQSDHTPGVTSYEHTFPIPGGLDDGDDVWVAAHAVVELFDAGGGAAVIVDQADPTITVTSGTNASGTPSEAIRFDFDQPRFYSLGIGGEFIAEYNCPFVEIPGDFDLQIWEDSKTEPYLETATIEVSPNGSTWTNIGIAGNQGPFADALGGDGQWRTAIIFEGNVAGNRYIRVRDTSSTGGDPSRNGFDLEAIKSNQACTPTFVGEETAWGGACGGDGIRFTPKGNWGTYMIYELQP